ncbi:MULTISPECIES: ribonuclease R [Thermus]|jgi:ribonuclease R|uniref:Ribonuclease R n=1 Tax=Thermus brockianus TaxID=56956 RepID=A0A1J0LQ97_THEBO|nr:ribonuclease R [Thermus brockianus]APD08448.1 exoribonuclease [Thermus brockianus]BDG16203.1 ribonuclease R [Thermus brockianus]
MQETLLEFFKKTGRPHRLEEILRRFGLEKREAKAYLKALVREGLLEKKGSQYFLPAKVVGPLSLHRDGYGFVRLPDKDLFIPPGYTLDAWPEDLVEARIMPPGRDGRPWGVVERVVKRARERVVGTLDFRRGYAVLVPDEPGLPELRLLPEGLHGLKRGSRIVVKVHYGKRPYGEFLEYLGEGDAPETETEAVIAKYGLRAEFPEEVLKEAEAIPLEIPEKELQRRQDFRALRVFTIDGVDAKDFDDAIHIERLPRGYRVGVHIADVSYYVQEGSPLDQEAFLRGTSVYLPGRVLPMLPERLSNGVCSLKPGEDRLTLSVLLDLTEDLEVQRVRFAEGVIRSVARLTYTEVEAFAEGFGLPEAHAFLAEDLRLLLDLTGRLRAKRLAAGALDFNFPEVKVEVEGGTLHLIPQAEPRARSLIEELMLLANQKVAEYLVKRGLPGLFRVHEEPLEEAYGKLRLALARLGYTLPEEVSPRALQKVLLKAKGRPEEPVVANLVLRSLRLARYAAENLGHFGLSMEHYLHFTSPIRRYPDLVVHRVLRAALRRTLTPAKKARWLETFPGIAEHASERERKAEAAERELTKYYMAKWAELHVGERFTGKVTGVASFGAFVTLKNGVEGLVRLEALGPYTYSEEALALLGPKGKRIRLGDEMEVVIAGANPRLRQIDLVPYREEEKENKASRKGASRKEVEMRKVVGPPKEKARDTRPERATVETVYFGEWQPKEHRETRPVDTRARRRRRRR